MTSKTGGVEGLLSFELLKLARICIWTNAKIQADFVCLQQDRMCEQLLSVMKVIIDVMHISLPN